MRVLVACEESQAVCIAFRERGHEAYSCDIQECSGGHPEWHLLMDVFEAISLGGWDLMIAFPPCTYLTHAGIGYFNVERWGQKAIDRKLKQDAAAKFFIALWECGINKICIENPVGHMNGNFRKPTQIIQPHYFGDPHVKRTCLWLKNLSRLNGCESAALSRNYAKPKPLSVQIRRPGKHYVGGEIKNRYFTDVLSRSGKARSKTFPGIARAMAEQWG